MLIMAPRVANFYVVQKTSVLEQIKELLPKGINGFQSLCRQEILPTILITRLMPFSIFPTIICPDKSKMVAVISRRELGLCRLCKLQKVKRSPKAIWKSIMDENHQKFRGSKKTEKDKENRSKSGEISKDWEGQGEWGRGYIFYFRFYFWTEMRWWVQFFITNKMHVAKAQSWISMPHILQPSSANKMSPNNHKMDKKKSTRNKEPSTLSLVSQLSTWLWVQDANISFPKSLYLEGNSTGVTCASNKR